MGGYLVEAGRVKRTVVAGVVPLVVFLFLLADLFGLPEHRQLAMDLGAVLLEEVDLLRIHLDDLGEFELGQCGLLLDGLLVVAG